MILNCLESGLAHAECLDSLWISSPGTVNGDQGTGIALLPGGDVVTSGYNNFSGIAQGVGWLIRLNPETGVQSWSRQYVGLGVQDVFLDVDVTNEGGLICGGWSRQPGDNDQDYWLYRLNANGDSIWSRNFGHEFGNQATMVAALQDGGFAIGGRAHSLPGGFGGQDWWIVKTNSDGDSLWSLIIGDSLEDTARDFIVAPNGNLVMVGNSNLDTSRAGRMVAISPNGDVMWNRMYEFAVEIELNSVMPDGEGYIACGYQQDLDEEQKVLVMGVDDAGRHQWHRRYELNTVGGAFGRSILADGNGGYYVLGHAQRTANTEKDVFVLHISACGDSLNFRWVGNAVDEEVARAVATPNGVLATAGVAVSPGNQRDILMYGISADTCNIPPCSFERIWPLDSMVIAPDDPTILIWHSSHDAEGSTIAYLINIESNYPIAYDNEVTDTSVWFQLLSPLSPLDEIFDFHWTVKATDGLDTIEASNGEGFFQLDIVMDADEPILYPSSFILSAFPNPFNPTTTLSFTLQNSSQVNLDLYDIQGRHVQSLVNQVMTAGSHNMQFDGTSLSSGIYFANLRASTQSRIAKLVLMK